jgi:hypothetical protein
MNQGIDHVAVLCDIADGGEVWTVENLAALMDRLGLDENDEVRGLEFGVLEILVREAAAHEQAQ